MQVKCRQSWPRQMWNRRPPSFLIRSAMKIRRTPKNWHPSSMRSVTSPTPPFHTSAFPANNLQKMCGGSLYGLIGIAVAVPADLSAYEIIWKGINSTFQNSFKVEIYSFRLSSRGKIVIFLQVCPVLVCSFISTSL